MKRFVFASQNPYNRYVAEDALEEISRLSAKIDHSYYDEIGYELSNILEDAGDRIAFLLNDYSDDYDD